MGGGVAEKYIQNNKEWNKGADKKKILNPKYTAEMNNKYLEKGLKKSRFSRSPDFT